MSRGQDDIFAGDALFRGIFESDIAGFVVGDLTTGKIVAINDRMLEITGADRASIIGRADSWREITPPEYQHLDERAASQVLERGSADPFEKEYQRPDGTRVPVRVSCALVRERPGLIIVQVQDISDHAAARRELAERELELAAAVRAGNLGVFEYDYATGSMHGSARFNELYGFPPGHHLTIEEVRGVYHPDDAERIRKQIAADNADPSIRHFEWRLHLQLPDGSERWIEGLGEYLRASDGSLAKCRGVASDITERVKGELHQRLLIAELNHRVKNSLAVVQSLAHQSFASDKSREEALRTFEGRLQALAAAHTILTEQKWEQALLSDIVEAAVSPHVGLDRVDMDGPRANIAPRLAVALAMALHELATNSTKYGSLSAPEGRIRVSWAVLDGRVELRWKEHGGPPVAVPSRRGFGTRMIERALAAEADGRVTLDFADDGVECLISAPTQGETRL